MLEEVKQAWRESSARTIALSERPTLEQQAVVKSGPISGDVRMQSPINRFPAVSTTLRNFIAEARFYNPESNTKASWWYGFYFSTSLWEEFVINFTNDRIWRLSKIDYEGIYEHWKSLNGGQANNLNVSRSGSNKISVYMVNGVIRLFINDDYFLSFDQVSRSTGMGIITGFYGPNLNRNRVMRYEQLTVKSLP